MLYNFCERGRRGRAQAGDVYGFGVICWEMVSHAHPWAGMTHAQIVYSVGMLKSQLLFPDAAPAAFVDLAKRCMSLDPASRPQFADLLEELQSAARLDGAELQVPSTSEE